LRAVLTRLRPVSAKIGVQDVNRQNASASNRSSQMSNSSPAQQGGSPAPAPQQGQQSGAPQQQQGQQPIFRDWAAI